MSISKLFSLDLWKNKPITIDVKQNDAGRNININLKANGEEVDLTGKTVKYFIKKGDGNTVFNNCNIVEGKIGSILVPLTNQAITIEGTNEMELAIYDENGAVESTFTVYLQVTKTLIDDNAIESSNEFKALNDALGMVQGIDNKFKAVDSQLDNITNEPNIYKCDFSGGRNTRGMVSFIDDDGNWDGIAWLQPLMDKYGWKYGIAMITGNINKEPYATTQELQQFQANGNEIYSHTVNHVFTDNIDIGVYENECRYSKEHLENIGINVKGIVYPGGGLAEETTQDIIKRNIELKSVIKKYYDVGYTTRAWNVRQPLDNLAIDRIMIGSYREDSVDTIDNWKSAVNKCIRDNGWLVLCTHASGTNTTKRALLEEFFLWLSQQNVDVVLPSKAFETYKSSYIQVGTKKFGVSEKGIHTNRGTLLETVKSEGYDEISAGTMFGDWKLPNGSTIVSKVNSTLATSQGIPEPNSGGHLVTLKWDTYEHCKQFWLPANSKNIYIRYSANSGNAWSSWTNMLLNQGDKNNILLGSGNTITPSNIDNSAILSGLNNIIKNHYSAIVNGRDNVVEGGYSIASGMNNKTLYGTTRLFGIDGMAKNPYCDIFSTGKLDVQGDNQLVRTILKGITNDATPTVITLNGQAASINTMYNLPLNTAYAIKGVVIGKSSSNTGCWEIKGLVFRDGGGSSVVGVSVTPINAVSGWNVELINSGSLNTFAVRVTGGALKKVKWIANIELTEITY